MPSKLIEVLKSRYLLTGLCFLVWMCFMDKDDVFSQLSIRRQIGGLQKEKLYYIGQIADMKTNLTDLSTNGAKLEKLAREKYFMKKDHEEVYVIIHEKKPATGHDSLIRKLKSLF